MPITAISVAARLIHTARQHSQLLLHITHKYSRDFA